MVAGRTGGKVFPQAGAGVHRAWSFGLRFVVVFASAPSGGWAGRVNYANHGSFGTTSATSCSVLLLLFYAVASWELRFSRSVPYLDLLRYLPSPRPQIIKY